MDIAIIGNGICSLTSAFKIALEISESDKIYIFGKREKEGSASNAAAAMLNSFAELESTSLRDDIDKYNFEISRKATSEWPHFNNLVNETIISNNPSLKEHIDISCGMEYGTFVINNSAANHIDDENFDFIVNSLDQYKEQYEKVCPKDIPFYKPSENKRATRSIYIKNEGWINPRRFINKIENALKRERAKLGIGEDSDIELVRSLVDLTKQYISENEAYLYFKCWSLKDGTKWYKLGVTVDLERREREQNVLPVPSQTLEQVSFDSQDAAYAAEKAFLQVLEEFKIKDANNRELMELNPIQVRSVILFHSLFEVS